jgi:hypothetical protein
VVILPGTNDNIGKGLKQGEFFAQIVPGWAVNRPKSAIFRPFSIIEWQQTAVL